MEDTGNKSNWTDEDDELIFVSYCEGMSTRAIQEELFPDRTLTEVKNRVVKLKNKNPVMHRGTSDDFNEKSIEHYRNNAKEGSRLYHEAMVRFYLNFKKKGRGK